MVRRLVLLGIAVLAVLAMPSAASASPQLMEGPTALIPGAEFEMTSQNVTVDPTFFGLFGTVHCPEWAWRVRVEKNNGSEIEAVGRGGETSNCISSGVEFPVTEPTLESLVSSGGDQGTVQLSYVWDVGPIECLYQGKGSFTYATGSDLLHIAGIELGSPIEYCLPEEGEIPSFFTADFTIATPGGGAPVIFG